MICSQILINICKLGTLIIVIITIIIIIIIFVHLGFHKALKAWRKCFIF